MKRLITLAIALFAALAVVVLDRSLGTATILDNETAPPTWVTVGRAYTDGAPWTFTSTNNGATWSSAVYPAATNAVLNGIATDGAGNWVAVGQDLATFRPWTFTSTNAGATWSGAVNPALNGILYGVAVEFFPLACVGDCDGDDTVAISELILGVNIALDVKPLNACLAFANSQGMVDIAQLIKGVENALTECGG
jgi:hypothetical protein